MKRVLFIAFEYPPVRASTDRIYYFSKYFARLGWKVRVLTVKGRPPFHFYDPSLPPPEGVRVERAAAWEGRISNLLYSYRLLPFHNAFFIPAIASGNRLLHRELADVIVATTPQVSEFIAGDWLSKKFHIPLVIDFRDPYFPPPLYRTMFENILRRATGLVTTSKTYADVLKRQSGRSDIHLIPNGVDLETISKLRRPKRQEFTVVYSGVLIDLYRVRALLEAVERVHATVPIRAIIIGETKSFEHLTRYAREHHLAITFTGRVSYEEATALTSEATIAYNGSSHPGGLGGKVYEAMALGLPILGYFPEGSQSDRFINEHGIGLVAHTPGELVRNLRTLAQNPKQVAQLAEHCSKVACAFDRRVLAEQYSAYLQKLIARA